MNSHIYTSTTPFIASQSLAKDKQVLSYLNDGVRLLEDAKSPIRITIIPFISSQLLKEDKQFLAYLNDGVRMLEDALSEKQQPNK
jgi:hypothetical protein